MSWDADIKRKETAQIVLSLVIMFLFVAGVIFLVLKALEIL